MDTIQVLTQILDKKEMLASNYTTEQAILEFKARITSKNVRKIEKEIFDNERVGELKKRNRYLETQNKKQASKINSLLKRIKRIKRNIEYIKPKGIVEENLINRTLRNINEVLK